MSEELGERKQDVGTRDSLIGYAIRLESRVTKDTRLVYATTVSIPETGAGMSAYKNREW